MERRVYTVEEAGKLLGLSRPSAYAAAASGDLPVIRIGRRLLVSKAAIANLLGETPEPAAAKG
jgi:excisionase family DNA binding protein